MHGRLNAESNPPTKWALLIGIDHYIQGTARQDVYYENLLGCVEDVKRMEAYLTSVGTTRIVKLTSTTSGSGNALPLETKDRWPTYNNIIRELGKIQSSARRGDLVYIHYSGHGQRRDELHLDDDGDNISGTALVMADVLRGGAYLSGYQLGVHVRRMVEEKGLRVTVVLDSCYSGRAFRGGTLVRAAPRRLRISIDKSQLPSDLEAEAAADRLNGMLDHSHTRTIDSWGRGSTAKLSWLLNPVGSTVICACSQEQEAGEDQVNRFGFLTHWMLEILNSHPPTWPPSAARVREHAAQRLKETYRRQAPVLHGDGHCQFFGHRALDRRAVCAVLSVVNNLVELDVGGAQGAAVGATYRIYPDGWHCEWGPSGVDFGADAPQKATSVIEITRVSDFSSEGKLVPSPNLSQPIQQGDRAVLHTWAFLKPVRVEVARSLLPIQDLLHAALVYIPSLHIRTGIVDFDFRLEVGSDGCFAMLDRNRNPLDRLPKVARDDVDAIGKIAFLMNHLARYLTVQRLQNNVSTALIAPDNFAVELRDEFGKLVRFDPECKRYLMKNGQTATVSFRNLRVPPPVYVTFLCLNSCWGVNRLYPAEGQLAECVDGGRATKAQLTMDTSNRPGDGNDAANTADDTIRVCVYVGDYPVSWDELLLADLPVEPENFWPALPAEAILAPVTEDNFEHARGISAVAVAKNKKRQEPRWTFIDLHVRTLPA